MAGGCGAWPVEPAGPTAPSGSAPIASSLVAPPASSTPTAPLPPPETSAFHVVATYDRPGPMLFGVPGGLFLVTDGALFPIRDELIVRDENLSPVTQAMAMGTVVVGVSGHAPDGLIAMLVKPVGRTGAAGLMRRENGVWKDVPRPNGGLTFLSTPQRWDHDRTVSLGTGMMLPATIEVVEGKRGVVPVLGPSRNPACVGTVWSQETLAEAMVAFPSGELYAAGPRCDSTTWQIEAFAPGSARSTVVAGPACQNAVVSMVGVKPSEVLLAVECRPDGPATATASFFSFDGKTLTPSTLDARAAFVAGDGTLFRAVPGALEQRLADGSFKRLPFADRNITSFYAATADDVWLGTPDALYRSGPAREGSQPQAFAVPAAGAQIASTSLRRTQAGTASCESLYVLLYEITKTTPADYDFPLTRKALKGRSELEGTRFSITRANGKQYFGAFPRSLESGKRLVSLVKKEVKDSSPQLLCARPEEVRELRIDLKTGDVVR